MAAKIHENETLIYFPTKGSACVYVLRHGDEIIYIGVSRFVYRRLAQHSLTKSFDSVGVIHCHDRKSANALESKLIAKHRPKFNVAIPCADLPDDFEQSMMAMVAPRPKSLAAMLKSKRAEAKLTVRQLAKLTGLSKTKISRLESDASQITLYEYDMICRALNIEIEIIT